MTSTLSARDAGTTLAFFSDIHANVAALRAVLADLDERRISRRYCLGDLVGYGPDPNGVIDLLRDAGIPTLLGNYDDGVGFERGDCGCYYATAEARRLGDASYAFTLGAVTPEGKAWLRGLPRELRVQHAGWTLRLVHGSPRRINEYLLAERDARTFKRLAADEDADALLFGHTHQAWHRSFRDVLFVNVGSAGRPKDGDPRAMVTLLHLPARSPDPACAPALPAVEVVRVPYNVDETVRGVLAQGLPPELAEAFRAGS